MTSLIRLGSPDDAAAVVRQGGLVVHPTVGLWGIGADPRHERAMQRLAAIKGASTRAGFIAIGGSQLQLAPWYRPNAVVDAVLAASWPGPVTVIAPASDAAPASICSSESTVAIRVETHPVAAAICRHLGSGIVSTSLNFAGEPATDPGDVSARLAARLDGYVQGGPQPRGLASTLVDLRGEPRVLRQGAVGLADIMACLREQGLV